MNCTAEQPILMSDRKGHNGITEDGTATTLNAQEKERPLAMTSIVRRLTPKECERLQGFPDDWTLIGEPEEVEVTDYKEEYDQDGNLKSRAPVGKHIETEYFYIDINGKKKRCADSARYKALGNSIATPFWFWLLRRISAQYERPATLGSLFDGIGGFPYCWEKCNGKGTAVWASEIEPFCIEVTRRRFPEEDENNG